MLSYICLVFYLFQITKPSATSFENLVEIFQKFPNVSSFYDDQDKYEFDFDLQYHEWKSQLEFALELLNHLTILVVISISGTM